MRSSLPLTLKCKYIWQLQLSAWSLWRRSVIYDVVKLSVRAGLPMRKQVSLEEEETVGEGTELQKTERCNEGTVRKKLEHEEERRLEVGSNSLPMFSAVFSPFAAMRLSLFPCLAFPPWTVTSFVPREVCTSSFGMEGFEWFLAATWAKPILCNGFSTSAFFLQAMFQNKFYLLRMCWDFSDLCSKVDKDGGRRRRSAVWRTIYVRIDLCKVLPLHNNPGNQ